MGAWWYLSLKFNRPVTVVARTPSASPATGSATRHKEQQKQLLDKAFGAGSTDDQSLKQEAQTATSTA
jgi:2-oxoglutarate dehydrogenase complex dehydrogenase (E1) component-like enzyme